MTAVDALRELLSLIHEADVRAPTALPDHEWQAIWDEAVTNAGAALAEAEKGESELVAAIRSIRAKLHAHNRGGTVKNHLRDELRDDCDAILSKHATPEHAKKG